MNSRVKLRLIWLPFSQIWIVQPAKDWEFKHSEYLIARAFARDLTRLNSN